MNINRYNYEECFLLYVDNELNEADRQAVEAFVVENPDLEEELTMLKSSILKPDTSLVLEDKSVLFKSGEDQLINLQNYETFFLLYVDEELNAEGRRAVEYFASQHPAQQQELEILMKTRLTPDAAVVFPNKQLLYREAGSGKVVAFKVWRIVAVAAMLILAVGIFWLTTLKENSNNNTAINNPAAKGTNKEEQSAQKSSEAQKGQPDESLVAGIEKQADETQQPVDKQSQKKKIERILPDQNEEPDETTDEKIIRPPMIAKVDAVKPEVIGSTDVSNKKLIIDQPYEQPKPNETAKIAGLDPEVDKNNVAIGPYQTKNKLRGFFRQVGRVVEKNTHLPVGENKKLLIGNLEIALK